MSALGTRRGLAAIAVAAIAIAQLASFAHRAAVRHVVCAEHNELVEVPAGPVNPADIARRPPDQAVWTASDAPSPAADTHCELACGFGPHVVTIRAPLPAVLALALPAAPFARAETTPPTALLYRLAPKTSPPHLAV